MCMEPASYEGLPDEELVLAARENRRAMEVLLKRYAPLVQHQAYALQCHHPGETEDLMQEGYLGLLSATCRFAPERGVPFSAFVVHCVRGHMYSALRRCRRIPLPIGSSDDSPFTELADPALPPDSTVIHRTQADALVYIMMHCLSQREYQVCMLIYGGATYAQAASQLHISEKSVDNALQRARRKLRTQ